MNIIEKETNSSKANRSLIRGADILRAFRPGSDLLGNGEISERTGLAASTVSRLTQTLVLAGLLQRDRSRRAYRLAPLVLSLGHAMRSGSQVLAVAAPRMRALAERELINVGLACPDNDEMVYLESIRYSRRVAFRNIVSGQRVPMELTSLGHAYLATLEKERYQLIEPVFKRRSGKRWTEVKMAIEASIKNIQKNDYCWATWQPGVLALASALHSADGQFVVNVSVSVQEPNDALIEKLAILLLGLKRDICAELLKLSDV